MVKVTVVNTGEIIEVIMVRSLLVSLQMHNFRIETRCGGKALCGKCVVHIGGGKKALNPISTKEQEKLTELGYGGEYRLACQTYPGKDITVEIVNYHGKMKSQNSQL